MLAEMRYGCLFLVAALASLNSSTAAGGERDLADFSLGVNVAAPLLYGGLAAAYDTTLVAVPLELSFHLSDRVGIASSIHYVYLTSERLYFTVHGDFGPTSFMADDAHQVFVGIGPRVSITGSGLDGWYAFLELAIVYSHAGGREVMKFPIFVTAPPSAYAPGKVEADRIDLGFRPEIGYAFSWGNPGFHLSLGLGMRVLFTAYCNPPPAEGHEISDVDMLIMYSPILNVTLGFDI